MVPLCSAGRTANRGREPRQFYQPHTIARREGSDKSARAATPIFTHNGAPQALAAGKNQFLGSGEVALALSMAPNPIPTSGKTALSF